MNLCPATHGNRPPRFLMGCCLLAILCTTDSPALPFNSQFNVIQEYDSNISRSGLRFTPLHDSATHVALAMDQPLVVDRDWLFSWGGKLAARHWWNYDRLDNAGLDGRISLRRKFGLGPKAPALRLDLSGGPQWARTRALGGWGGGAGLSFSHRPIDWLRYGVSYDSDRKSSKDSFFSLGGNTGALTLQATLSSWLSISLSGRQRVGSLLAFATPSAHYSGIYPSDWPSKYVEVFGTSSYAYRLIARTRGATLAANFALGPRKAFTLSYDNSLSVRLPWRYRVHFFSAGLALQF